MEKNTANMDINVTPDIRFPGFSEKWEIKTLGELATKVNRKNRQLQVSRVLTNSATEGIIDQNDYFDRDIAVKENTENYHIVEAGDFVYNPRISVSAPVGPISVNKVGTGIMSPLYTVFRIQDGYIPFYEQYFQTKIWHSYLKSIANFGARFDRMNITTEGFFNMPIFVPSFAEQKKIAECLEVEDKMIAAQKQKVESLKAHKIGLMQQLFPQPGTTTPSLRFPGFTGEWEENKLASLCINEDSKRRPVAKSQRELGKYPYYGANGIQDYVNDFLFSGERLLVGEDGSVLSKDNTPIVNWASGEFWVNNHAHVLAQKKGISLKYIFYILSTIKIQGLVTGIPPKLNQENLNNINISLPSSLVEQEKIAECLSTIDDIIDAEQNKLDALTTHKKGLMQQLFPQPVK